MSICLTFSPPAHSLNFILILLRNCIIHLQPVLFTSDRTTTAKGHETVALLVVAFKLGSLLKEEFVLGTLVAQTGDFLSDQSGRPERYLQKK